MSSIAISLMLARLVLGDLTPVAPGPGESFIAGSNCTIQWDADTSATWKNVTIGLMSGSNDNMTLVTKVASAVDGTNASLSPFSWTCPEVDPYSEIYFYQFTNDNDRMNSKWTTRFTIASPSNMSVPPEHSQQPNGDPVPWGNGVLVSSGASKMAAGNMTNDGFKSTHAANSSTSTTVTSGTISASTSGQPLTAAATGTAAPGVINVASDHGDAGDSDDPTTQSDGGDVTKTSHHDHSTEHSRPHSTDAADSGDSDDRAGAQKVDATATPSPSPTSTDGGDSTGDSSDGSDESDGSDDSDDGSDNSDDGSDDSGDGTDDSTMTSVFMASSRMKKMQATQTATHSHDDDHSTRLAPTVSPPSRDAQVASPASTGSATGTSLPANGVKLANDASPRFYTSVDPAWLYALVAAAWAL